MEWQPINEASFMTWVLGYFGSTRGEDPCDMAVCQLRRGGWVNDIGTEIDAPTHFMPLPPPPGDER